MAENKKSFLLYCDLIHTIEKLPNEKAGELFKHILMYVNDKDPQTDDLIVSITFEPIKQQLKRDLKNWEESLTSKSNAGRLGNLKRWNPDIYDKVIKRTITIEEAEIIALNRRTSQPDILPSQTIAKIAVNVNDNVTVNDNEKINKRDAAKAATQKRILEFKESLYPFTKNKGGLYDADTVKDFFEYWSELNKSETKMLWELKATFEISKRLATWVKNENKFKGNGKTEQPKSNIYTT